MANLDHIMPQPHVIPILWGHDYVANPIASQNLNRMVLDLVTGPFMNGMAQYGVQRGTVAAQIIIDDANPPTTLVYTDQQNNMVDDITKQLIKWIAAGTVPPPPSATDINQLYLIFPPTETIVEMYNTAADPIGNGAQGFHNEGNTNPPSPPTYYWAIVKTGDVSPVTSPDFGISDGLAQKVCHELAEQFVDRNGEYQEVGDPCINNPVIYQGFTIQQYVSVWNNNNCINGDAPVSLKRFLQAIDFNTQSNGLLSLGTPTININYIAVTMQSLST